MRSLKGSALDLYIGMAFMTSMHINEWGVNDSSQVIVSLVIYVEGPRRIQAQVQREFTRLNEVSRIWDLKDS